MLVAFDCDVDEYGMVVIDHYLAIYHSTFTVNNADINTNNGKENRGKERGMERKILCYLHDADHREDRACARFAYLIKNAQQSVILCAITRAWLPGFFAESVTSA